MSAFGEGKRTMTYQLGSSQAKSGDALDKLPLGDEGEVANNLLHDLNNSLSIISSRLELAMEGCSDTKVRRNLQKAMINATKAVEMVRLLSQCENTQYGEISK